MNAAASEVGLPLLQRLWIYQDERFPLLRTSILVAVFSAASINVSAYFAGRPTPPWPTYVAAFAVVLIFMFQLRVCDEIKDADDDRKYRSGRAIPRGLVTLNLIVGLGLACIPVAVAAAATIDLRMVWLVLLVWGWMGLMTFEFGVPRWLKARPFIYLVSHMLIMPLIDLFVTGCEWLRAGDGPPHALGLFLALSFINGCVLEIGRKIFRPANELPGVETYSALLGYRKATLLWMACLLASYCLLVAVGVTIGAQTTLVPVGIAGLAVCLTAGFLFMRDPESINGKMLDTVSGLWVLACYGSAGYAPLLMRWLWCRNS
jgi:4-hydroxybenzoate polyprenyltransferase